jgi:ParB/RepB/Spo0J family partition protein
VTPADGENAGKFYVHSGHRRCEALRHLRTPTVPAVVRRDLDERGMRRLALADNLGREDLTVCEQAKALKDFCDAYELGVQAAGEELGVNRSIAFRLNTIARSSDRLLAKTTPRTPSTSRGCRGLTRA